MPPAVGVAVRRNRDDRGAKEVDDDRHAPERSAAPWQRPQAIVLTFCALYMRGRPEAVYSGSLVEVLGHVGVGEHAARSTLARMCRRGLLERHRLGKRVYFALTDHAATVLEEGGQRVEQLEAVNRNWDGTWTLLGFSLPETRRSDRHVLRSRLSWSGFGLLQSGVWIAPRAVDVEAVLEGLDVARHVKAFRARTLLPTDVDEMIADAWDLDGLAARYREFLVRWDVPEPMPNAADALSRQLLMLTEWLLLVRDDPRLPVEHLPSDWPAVRAEQVTMRLRAAFAEPAERVVDELVSRLPLQADGAPRRR